MKSKPLSALIKVVVITTAMVLYWEYRDQLDFKEVFNTANGQLIQPTAQLSVGDYIYINDKGWGHLLDQLSSEQDKNKLKSILEPIFNNKLSEESIVIPDFTEETWEKAKKTIREQEIKFDTSIYFSNEPLRVRQKAEFDLEYTFRIEGQSLKYYFSLESIIQSKNDTLSFKDYQRYINTVDSLLKHQKAVSVSYLKDLKNSFKYLQKRDDLQPSNLKRVYLLKDNGGKKIYKDEAAFDSLVLDETYLSWRDSWAHIALFGILCFTVFITMIRLFI